jgi:hypothetical protein
MELEILIIDDNKDDGKAIAGILSDLENVKTTVSVTRQLKTEDSAN